MSWKQAAYAAALVWVVTSGQAQGSGKLLSLFLHTLRTLSDFKQCMTGEGRLLRQLSDTSSSSSLRRPIQLVSERAGGKKTRMQIRIL